MSSFQYSKLEDGMIRVMELSPGLDSDEIRASLKTSSITEPCPSNTAAIPRYSALSYTWGLDNQPCGPIYLDDHPFQVRQNLLEALQQLRDPDAPRYLWIDAICINQKDTVEKKMQIPLMGLIYSKAETVEIWLGTGELNGELGLQALVSRDLPDIATPDVILAIADLLERPWYTRVWIIQELLLSVKDGAFVRCGCVRVTWDAFAAGITRLMTVEGKKAVFQRGLVPLDSTSNSEPKLADGDIQLLWLHNRLATVMLVQGLKIHQLCFLQSKKDGGTNAASRPIVELLLALIRFRYARATEPKDKIFGLCGMLMQPTVDELMKVFNKPSDQVFFAVTTYLMEHDIRPSLYFRFPTIGRSRARATNLPSWTIDFAFTDNNYAELCFSAFADSLTPGGPQASPDFGHHWIIDDITAVTYVDEHIQAPDNPMAWDKFGHNLCESIPATIHREFDVKTVLLSNPYFDYKAYTRTAVEDWKFMSFLETAHDLYQRQRQSATETREEKTAAFFALILANKIVDEFNPEEKVADLIRQGNDLLGLGDTSPVEDSMLLAHAIALDLPDAQTAADRLVRRSQAGELFGALHSILSPLDNTPGCYNGLYMTGNGLCGVCFPGAAVGDVIARVFLGTGSEAPFVLRPEGDNKYSMVCVASVSPGWQDVHNLRGEEEVILI